MVWEEIRKTKTENKHELVLSGEEIASKIEKEGLDNHLFKLTHINFLELSKTCLEVLPDDLGNLVNLENLSLHSNKLTALPETLGKLTKLKYLDVSKNQLETFPESVSQITTLMDINLSINKLTSLPSLKDLKNLHHLNVCRNELQEFPEVFTGEGNVMIEISLSDNAIPSIPPQVSALSYLRTLDVSNNNLLAVPGDLADCTKLKDLNLKGNEISDRRVRKVVDQGKAKQILDYVRANCPRVASDGGGGGKQGKGKKNKKGKKRIDSEGDNEVESLCDELRILHVGENSLEVKMDPVVVSVRPHIICCIVRNVDLQGNNFKSFISAQTKLHDTVCEKRVAATIATHDLGLLPGSFVEYTAWEPNALMITPLGKTAPCSARSLYDKLQNEAEALKKEKKRTTYSGIHKFLYLLQGKQLWPCLRNSEEEVISFPPITNSDISKISPETTDIFIEVTSSSSQPVCKKVMDDLLVAMLDLGLGEHNNGQKTLTVQQVRINNPEGNMKCVYPSKVDLNIHDKPNFKVIR